MILTRNEFKLIKKMQKILDFAIEYTRSDYVRERKHNHRRKIVVSENYREEIKLSFGIQSIALIKPDRPGEQAIWVKGQKYELRDYDEDEIFNMRTLLSNDDVTAIKVYSRLNFHGKSAGFYTMDYELICDTAAAIDQQFRKFDRGLFEYS